MDLQPAITRRQMMQESCSNPLKVEKSLVLCNQNTVSVLDLGFFLYAYMMAGCLSIFCLHYDDVINPWEATKRADFVAQHFFYSRL